MKPRTNWKQGLVAAVLLVGSLSAWAAAPSKSGHETNQAIADGDVQVMVLGTWHFATPRRDLHNIEAEDVLQPARQQELDDLARRLAAFRPTKVVVEKSAKQPGLEDDEYPNFTLAHLASERNERFQIGYRVAHRMGLKTVYAIDEQPEAGEPDYFPFDQVKRWADANARAGDLDKVMAIAGTFTKDFERRQAQQTLLESLIEFNDPKGFQGRMDVYYGMLGFGGEVRQPGAELNAMWYLRNAKIFAKLMGVAQPGDRVLVVYGAGHGYWLRHFADQVPGYRNVDPLPLLQSPASSGAIK